MRNGILAGRWGRRRRAFSHGFGPSSADTIYALATARGRAGVGIIRVSGGETRQVLAGILPRVQYERVVERPRFLHRVSLEDAPRGLTLDHGMAVYFAGPASFTGEDVAELHIHSSRAVIQAVYAQLARLPGVRLAEPGEFSRRAFLHGKMDLTQTEGLGDLLAAETETQRQLAMAQLAGSNRGIFETWRNRIVQAMAMTEAWIDFAEEENIEADTLAAVQRLVAQLAEQLRAELSRMRVGEIIKGGLRVALCGPPNAGKSSILNKLARRQAAIVSPVAGTTRDILEVSLEVAGQAVVLMDTAGLRDAHKEAHLDPVEREGIRRALEAAETADHVLFVVDAGTLLAEGTNGEFAHLAALDPARVSVIFNKIDLLAPGLDEHQLRSRLPPPHQHVPAICHSTLVGGEGVDRLRDELLGRLVRDAGFSGRREDLPAIANERQRMHAEAVLAALGQFEVRLREDIVVASEDLRQAAAAIGRITGHIDSEEVLDRLFSTFCIGK